MRLASVSASPRSWVTKSTVCRSRSQISSRVLCISSLVCVSSAPKGSSIRRISGSMIECAHQRHALTHPAREHAREALVEAREPGGLDRPPHLRLALRLRHARDLEPVADVGLDGAPREHGVALEDVADLAVHAAVAHLLAVEANLAAGAVEQARDDVEDGRLAAARTDRAGRRTPPRRSRTRRCRRRSPRRRACGSACRGPRRAMRTRDAAARRPGGRRAASRRRSWRTCGGVAALT